MHVTKGKRKSKGTDIAVRESTSPLQEITCHMGSHSVTCHPAAVTFPPLPQPKPVLDFATRRNARLSWSRWWLHPEIVYPPKTVTYLRIDQAVVSMGFAPEADSCESNVLISVQLTTEQYQ